jgi:hypothetical protein
MASPPVTVPLDFSPKKLARDLTQQERDRSAALLDVTAKQVDQQILALELKVTFQSIRILRGWVLPTTYYVGSIGAEITVRGTDAEVVDYTRSSAIAVEYAVSVDSENVLSKSFNSEIKFATGMDLKFEGAQRASKSSQGSSTKFASQELLVVSADLPETVRWYVDNHRGGKAVRDYLTGNQIFEAVFKWKRGPRCGEISMLPDIRFFNPDKKALSRKASILMRFVLWQKDIRLANEQGLKVSFVEMR